MTTQTGGASGPTLTYRLRGEIVTLPAAAALRIRPVVEGLHGIRYLDVSLFMADVLDAYQLSLVDALGTETP